MSESIVDDIVASYTGQNYTRYPSPFFDLSKTYFPASVKGLFKWCRYFFYKSGVIKNVVIKKSEYPITDIIVDTENEDDKKRWNEIIEQLHLKSFLIYCGYDYFAMGNSISSVLKPFKRFLVCPKEGCAWTNVIDKVRYKWQNFSFKGRCPKCGAEVVFNVVDQDTKEETGLKLKRWNIENIDIQYEEVTDSYTYIYKIPQGTKTAVRKGTKTVLHKIPWIFVEAIKEGKNIEMDNDHIYHFKHEGLSETSQEWGKPDILAALPQVFYLFVLKKAQEAIAMERTVPLRVFYPRAGDGLNPYQDINLNNWKKEVEKQVKLWKKDPNHIAVMPIPMGYENLGGEAKALLLTQEIDNTQKEIVISMECPLEFVYGGASWCQDVNSYIFTNKGMITLKESLKHSKESALTHFDGTIYSGKKSILNPILHKAGNKPYILIKTKSGLEIKVSKDHRLRILNEDLSIIDVKAESLKLGSYAIPKIGGNVWPEKQFKINYDKPKYSKRVMTCKLPEEITPELSRIMGYLVSEGTCSSKPTSITFTNTDIDILNDFTKCFESVFGYTPSINNKKIGANHFGKKPITSIDICRQEIVDFLRFLGVKGTSFEKTVPWSIRVSNKECVLNFIKAFTEGDGCITDSLKKQRILMISASKKLLQEIQLLLLNLGIVSRLPKKNKNRSVYDLYISSCEIDKYIEQIGFMSSRRIKLSKKRTPTKESCDHDKVPYLKEALDRLRINLHKNNCPRNSWVKEEKEIKLDKDEYTTRELGDLCERDFTSIIQYIKSGKLKAVKKLFKKSSIGWIISKKDALSFLENEGFKKHASIPLRPVDGATYKKVYNADFSYIKEIDEPLYDRIQDIKENKYFFDEIVEITPCFKKIQMMDVSMDGTDPYYQSNGLITHNSASSVALRILENNFLNYREHGIQPLLNFVIRDIAKFLGITPVKVHLSDFKMADDIQQKKLMLDMVGKEVYSIESYLDNLGIDSKIEHEKIIKQLESQFELAKKKAIYEVQIQAEQQLSNAEAQAKVRDKIAALNPPTIDMNVQLQSWVQELMSMKPQQQQAALQKVQSVMPQLYEILVASIQNGGTPPGQEQPQQEQPGQQQPAPQPGQHMQQPGQKKTSAEKSGPVDMRPNPTKLPPRREQKTI